MERMYAKFKTILDPKEKQVREIQTTYDEVDEYLMKQPRYTIKPLFISAGLLHTPIFEFELEFKAMVKGILQQRISIYNMYTICLFSPLEKFVGLMWDLCDICWSYRSMTQPIVFIP